MKLQASRVELQSIHQFKKSITKFEISIAKFEASIIDSSIKNHANYKTVWKVVTSFACWSDWKLIEISFQ